jgi:hypothetical protein
MDQRLKKHRKILRVRIKQAEYLGQEEQKLEGKKLQCDKVQLSYEFDYQSFRAPTAQLGTGGARITVWYHESIPIDGVVRRETNGSTSILSDYGRRQEGP